MRIIPALLLLSLAVGCAQTQTYRVSLANHTHEPITFGVVKEGGPFERQWESPEEATINGDKPNAAMWGAIPAGRTAVSHPLSGKFGRGATAVLRVYQGSLKWPEILAISRGQPNRVDVPLHPGMNHIAVTDEGGHFDAQPDDAASDSPVLRQ